MTISDTSAAATRSEAVDSVCRAVLEVLSTLPERPGRLRLSNGDVSVELDWPVAPVVAAAPHPVQPVPAQHSPAPQHASPATGGDNGQAPPQLHYVCAPTIGTFYHSPEPGAAPFVTEGMLVGPGQQIGIVEAMKLMIPVEADRRGRVVQVLVPDGQPVEYGQEIIAIGPTDE